MLLTVILRDFFFDFLDFHVGRKKIIKLGSFTARKNQVNVTVLVARDIFNIFCGTFTV